MNLSNSLRTQQQHKRNEKNTNQQSSAGLSAAAGQTLKSDLIENSLPSPRALAERLAPPTERLPAEAALGTVSLPIQKNGQLEPIQISTSLQSRHHRLPSQTMIERNLINGQTGKQSERQNQDSLRIIFSPSSDQAQIASTALEQAASIAKTRICEVMKHTPPRPPQPQVHKLPPMGSIAHSKQPLAPKAAEDQLGTVKSAQNMQPIQNNQSFLNQNLAKSAQKLSSTKQVTKNGLVASSNQAPFVYEMSNSSSLTPLEDFLGRNSANSITFHGQQNKKGSSSTPQQDQNFNCTQFSVRPYATKSDQNLENNSMSFGANLLKSNSRQNASRGTPKQRGVANVAYVGNAPSNQEQDTQQVRPQNSLLQDNSSVIQMKQLGKQTVHRTPVAAGHLPNFARQTVTDDALFVGTEGKPFKIPAPHSLTPYGDMLGGSSRRRPLNPELEQEDFEFLNKLGTEFGNHSQANLFSEAGDALSSCEREYKRGGAAGCASSSPSHSRDLNEDSLSNPNLLSILQNNMDSLNQLQSAFSQQAIGGGSKQNVDFNQQAQPQQNFKSHTTGNNQIANCANNTSLAPAIIPTALVEKQSPGFDGPANTTYLQNVNFVQQMSIGEALQQTQPDLHYQGAIKLQESQQPSAKVGPEPSQHPQQTAAQHPQQGRAMSQVQTMPATSFASTNQFIINNLNFISKSTPRGGQQLAHENTLPPTFDKHQSLSNFLPLCAQATDFLAAKDTSGELKDTLGAVGVEGFDLIMQDGERANDFLSSLPPQSETEQQPEAKTTKSSGKVAPHTSNAYQTPCREDRVPQDKKGASRDNLATQFKAEGDQISFRRQKSQQQRHRQDAQPDEARVLQSPIAVNQSSQHHKFRQDKRALTDVKAKLELAHSAAASSRNQRSNRQSSKSQRNRRDISNENCGGTATFPQSKLERQEGNQQPVMHHHHHIYVIQPPQQQVGQTCAHTEPGLACKQGCQCQCRSQSNLHSEVQRMQLVKLLQQELSVEKPITIDVLRQYGVVKPRGSIVLASESITTPNGQLSQCEQQGILSAFNLYPRPKYQGNGSLASVQQSCQQLNLGPTAEMKIRSNAKSVSNKSQQHVGQASGQQQPQAEVLLRQKEGGKAQTVGASQAEVEIDASQKSVSDITEGRGRGPPLLFKVERVLGVHQCALSNRTIIEDFIRRYNCQALDGQLDQSLRRPMPATSVTPVGKLTSIDRYLKVKRYLDKRQKRIWMKKVSYTTRKDASQKRLRIKGRFIKKEAQEDIMQRIFADEALSQSNVQDLNRNLNDLVNSPNPKGEQQLLMAMAPTPTESKSAKKEVSSAQKKQLPAITEPKKPRQSTKQSKAKPEETKSAEKKTTKQPKAAYAETEEVHRKRGRPPSVNKKAKKTLTAKEEAKSKSAPRKRDKKASAKQEATEQVAVSKHKSAKSRLA